MGNGLGGRALSHLPLEHYTDIVYSSGILATYTLGNGDFSDDPSDDMQVLLTAWLQTGGRDLFLAGDRLATNLSFSAEGQTFLTDVMGVEYLGWNLASPSSRTSEVRRSLPMRGIPCSRTSPPGSPSAAAPT